MAKYTPGIFVLPPVRKTSELENNSRFSSIREYAVNASTLSGTVMLELDDLPANAIVYQIDLLVNQAFTSASAMNLEVQSKHQDILFSKNWNDPGKLGTYSSQCYYITDGSSGEIRLLHSLGGSLSGLFILRLYLYENVTHYESLITSEDERYATMDHSPILVKL